MQFFFFFSWATFLKFVGFFWLQVEKMVQLGSRDLGLPQQNGRGVRDQEVREKGQCPAPKSFRGAQEKGMPIILCPRVIIWSSAIVKSYPSNAGSFTQPATVACKNGSSGTNLYARSVHTNKNFCMGARAEVYQECELLVG